VYVSALKEARRQAIESLQTLIRVSVRLKRAKGQSYWPCLAQREASRQAAESLKILLNQPRKHKRA